MTKHKPKVWNIAVLTAMTAVIAAVLLLTGEEDHTLALYILMDVYLAAVIILLIRAFFKQIRYNLYSYNTIIYSGFALFTFFVLMTFLNLTRRFLMQTGDYGAEEIVHVLLGSAKNYMIFTSPFILLFSAALCISNVSLIRHEGKRLVNILGIILSVLMIGGIVFLLTFDFYATGSRTEVMIHDLIVNLFAAVYLYFECMLVGTILANMIAVRKKPAYDKDAVIILGCGVRKDGTPSPLLRGRIDRALKFRKEQLENTGKDVLFVTSGGQGPKEVRTESSAMKDYLLEKGVPEDRIIEEDQSTSTFENMQFSKEKLGAVLQDPKVGFATTNYHVFRSGIFAKRQKMDAEGMGAKTKWYFWPNASVREFVGLLSEHRGKQALILVSMIVFYVALTLYVYRY